MTASKHPGGLSVRIEGGAIVVSLSIDALPFVLAGVLSADGGGDFEVRLADEQAFASELVRVLEEEDDAGNNFAGRMFVDAIREAMHQGADGLSYYGVLSHDGE